MCVQPLHKAARPGTRVCDWLGSVALHPASHRLAERNRSVALRRPDSHVGRTEQHCITPRTVPEPERPLSLAPASVRPAPAAAYGLAPLCHLCPATATADAVSASGPKQHRPSDGRPLQRWFEFQRHHPPEGSCRGFIFLLCAQSCCRTSAFLCDKLSDT